MAGASEGRSLEQTPTWAVATVCFVLIVISIVIEQTIHKIEQVIKYTSLRTYIYMFLKFSLYLLKYICLKLFLISGSRRNILKVYTSH